MKNKDKFLLIVSNALSKTTLTGMDRHFFLIFPQKQSKTTSYIEIFDNFKEAAL